MNLASLASVPASVLAFLSLAAAGCDSAGSPSAADGRVEILLGSSSSSELASLHVTIEDIRLVSDSDATTGNLLSAPLEVELVGLDQASALVVSALTRRGTYQNAEITFQPGSLHALRRDGTEEPVLELASHLRFRLDASAIVVRRGYTRVRLSLDLRGSIDGTFSPVTLAFCPLAAGTGSSAPHMQPMDDLEGLVLAKDETAGTLTVRAFRDDDLTTTLRTMQVVVTSGAYLEDEDDGAFADPAGFFASLLERSTLLELHGGQDQDGLWHAERIEIEDQLGGAGAEQQVEIEGYLAGLDTLGTMRLSIQEIEQGKAVAAGVLSALGDPTAIDVVFDGTLPVFQPSGLASTPAALAVGQRVKVEFRDFLGTPFPARSVEITALATFEAEIEQVRGSDLLVKLRPGDFALQSGLVQDAETAVAVDLSGADLRLDTLARPTLGSMDLRRGQRSSIRGALSGSPASPSLEATQVLLVPGRLRGEMTSTDPAAHSFEAFLRELPQGFGPTIPVANVVIHPDCAFHGDAANEVELFDLFSSLAPEDALLVEVQGVASGNQNEVTAYVIEVVPR